MLKAKPGSSEKGRVDNELYNGCIVVVCNNNRTGHSFKNGTICIVDRLDAQYGPDCYILRVIDNRSKKRVLHISEFKIYDSNDF